MAAEPNKTPAPCLDNRLHIERLPITTLYKADHRLETGCVLVGFVFRNATTLEVALVADCEQRILTATEFKRLMTPAT